ncbi:unnamed protein product [Mytilus coruscus]|uniref:TRIM2_3 n=1 Tax=Mytilus coruscus TaxID=42192 RepID=A0A6J8ABF9_MYTCO|nr:unnamed protein product [Mytilus coruscus]
MNLNKYLDELERKLLLDLKSKHENSKFKYNNILRRLTKEEKEIEKLKRQIVQMKRFASDLQVFLGTRQLNKAIIEKFKALKEEMRGCMNKKMEIEIHHVISALMKEVTQFGQIKVIETKASLQLKDAKIDQAQIQIHGSLQNVENINLQLKQTIDIKGSEKPITGCVILPDDRIIIADFFGSGKLMEYGKDGKPIRDIPVSDGPYGPTVIDTDRVAVTYGNNKCLEIINYMDDKERKKIQCSNPCWGISYQEQKLYVVNLQGIVVMDLTGKTLNTIDINVLNNIVNYITTTRDRIYYTNGRNETVHCCSMTGQDIWIFKHHSTAQPREISVDNNQNVFVIGRLSNNLTVIHHDGKDSKVLLTQ